MQSVRLELVRPNSYMRSDYLGTQILACITIDLFHRISQLDHQSSWLVKFLLFSLQICLSLECGHFHQGTSSLSPNFGTSYFLSKFSYTAILHTFLRRKRTSNFRRRSTLSNMFCTEMSGNNSINQPRLFRVVASVEETITSSASMTIWP